MGKLQKAKNVIKEYIEYARSGIFDCRNIIGDEMITIYKDDELQIDICYEHQYFEVFGLSDDEFCNLGEYYRSLNDE